MSADYTIDAVQCEVCQEYIPTDLIDRLSGEQVDVCPDCKKHVRECEACGKQYLTASGLALGSVEEDANIRQDRLGRWLCDECRAEKKEYDKWQGAHMKRKQRQEEGF